MNLYCAARSASGIALVFLQLTSAGCSFSEDVSDTASLPVAAIEQEIRIGALDDPEYAFGSVRTLEVGTDGSIYSLHPQESAIRRWSEDGRALGTIGRQGEGPGEFTSPVDMGWRADSLWVFDSTRNSRITFFDAEGKYLTELTPAVDIGSLEQANQGIYPARPAGLLGDGTIHGSTPGFSRHIVEGSLTSIAHVRMDREGATLDTILTVPVGRENVLGILRDGGGTFSSQIFGDGVLNILTRDYDAFLVLERPASDESVEAEFRLHRVDLNGDTTFSRAYPYLPVPIPRDSIENVITAQAEGLHRFVGQRTGTTLAQWRELVREAIYAPAHYTPVSELVAGRDGTIWLALNPSEELGTGWLVLDNEGEPIGKLTTPPGMNLLMADRSNLWGVERDELDVEYIVRYRITFPPTA